jgi:hypothetical protein
METPERDQSTIRLQDYAETGSDRSAGAATRATAFIVTAILLSWALFRRGCGSVAEGSRRPMSALSAAVRQIGRALIGAVRLAGGGLTAVTRGKIALKAVVRRVRDALTVIEPVGAALMAAVGWAGESADRVWRAFGSIGRIVAAGIVIMAGSLSALALGAARLLGRCARPLGFLLRGAWFSVRRVGSVLWAVGQAVMRAVARALRTAGTVLRRVFAPFRLAVRAAVFLAWKLAGGVVAVGRTVMRAVARAFRTAGTVLRRVFAPFRLAVRAAVFLAWKLVRGVVAVIRLVGQAAFTTARPFARVLAVSGRLAFRVAVAIAKATGRLLLKVVRPLLRAAAVLVVAAHRLLTAIARRIERVISFGLDMLVRVVTSVSRGVAPLRDACRCGIGRIAEASADLSRRTAGGARVAAGTARHRANRLAVSASNRDWRIAAYADGSPSVVSDDEDEASFTLDVHENEYLRPAESTISAVISINSEIHRESTGRPEMVEVVLLDCSASMGYPWDKILHARQATQAAVAGLPDGVWFAVVRGAESAEVAYPRRGGLVQASDRTRREASRAISALRPVGGTAIGRWLSLASDLVALRPGAIGGSPRLSRDR